MVLKSIFSSLAQYGATKLEDIGEGQPLQPLQTAVNMYRAMIDRLWTGAAKGKEGAALLQNLLDHF
jgi:hypothetical protein